MNKILKFFRRKHVRVGMVFFVAFLALILLIAGGCDRFEHEEKKDSWKFWEKEGTVNETAKPSRVFRERCESVQAFRIYKDHNDNWACKLPDGRVLTDN